LSTVRKSDRGRDGEIGQERAREVFSLERGTDRRPAGRPITFPTSKSVRITGLTEDVDLRQQPDDGVVLHPSRPPSIRPCISGGPSPALVKLCHVGKPEHEVPALLLRWARGKARSRTVGVTVLAFVGD